LRPGITFESHKKKRGGRNPIFEGDPNTVERNEREAKYKSRIRKEEEETEESLLGDGSNDGGGERASEMSERSTTDIKEH